MGTGIEYVIMAITAAVSYDQQQEAKEESRAAAKEQRKAQAEQKALNAQKAAEERRQQVREERVRRAKVLQASENSGTEGSSGEMGAIGSLSTQLASNIGSNVGSIMHGQAISDYQQTAADFTQKANEAIYTAQQVNTFGTFASNIASGLNKTTKTK